MSSIKNLYCEFLKESNITLWDALVRKRTLRAKVVLVALIVGGIIPW